MKFSATSLSAASIPPVPNPAKALRPLRECSGLAPNCRLFRPKPRTGLHAAWTAPISQNSQTKKSSPYPLKRFSFILCSRRNLDGECPGRCAKDARGRRGTLCPTWAHTGQRPRRPCADRRSRKWARETDGPNGVRDARARTVGFGMSGEDAKVPVGPPWTTAAARLPEHPCHRAAPPTCAPLLAFREGCPVTLAAALRLAPARRVRASNRSTGSI